ncbi:CBS domain-containing protein [Aureitalea marina]|uniref:CBS domain-containing protein n=1 Tax=Aureitalea marina TaxID=930804 RepID=A0A2S7KNH3_9FLAO|nr:CBS domain-containing protein [Aureitalea marina]PQB04162.1 hypothetical protein BST85_04025 [Aureitalea marina]
MGEHSVQTLETASQRAAFIHYLIQDIRALEYMLQNDLIESGITRIGAEQEFCLVTADWRPSDNNMEVLKAIDDDHFTTELATYNLEINLDPVELKAGAMKSVHHQLDDLLDNAGRAARRYGTNILLTGILPTIGSRHLGYDYITPSPRYYALNQILKEVRSSDFQLHLRGVDELSIIHDTVLFEACNTSFQLHLQIDPNDFVSSFNWSQAISGPVLGVSTNSPLLLGRELWSETRIALFQQSIDTRNTSYALKDQRPRVSFGKEWATGTTVDIFKDNIAQYPAILSTKLEDDSYKMVQEGKIPKLRALGLHSGTIYPWNRACYGVGNGKPHLRIENRYIPAGPTTLDAMATFAFWVGLMQARPTKFDNIPEVMDFREVKNNFINSARAGLDTFQCWDGKRMSTEDLVTKELLPIAYRGLTNSGLDKETTENYLRVIEQRAKGKTGSKWLTRNYRKLRKENKIDHSLRLLTQHLHQFEQSGKPVHEWTDIACPAKADTPPRYVGHIMSSQLFTVHEDDLANLAIEIMQWKDIHHMPVTDHQGKLTGLLTWTHVERFGQPPPLDKDLIVGTIMEAEVITTTPRTSIQEAITHMKTNEIGCLPVLQKGDLVGIITIKDVIAFDHDPSA